MADIEPQVPDTTHSNSEAPSSPPEDNKTDNITYHSDGTWNGKFETGSWGILQPKVVLISGTWTLTGDVIKYTVTKSSYMNDELSDQIATDKILSINENVAVLLDQTFGEGESTWMRSN